ncbi:MAG: transglutaminase domain-containing protein [Ruminococcaceae bacterium]|nr:transglutaminase domain-containing protein [Oscillospiraceae bacterium]
MTEKIKKHRTVKIIILASICLLLIASLVLNIYFLFFYDVSYLQSPDEIYIVESGIIKNNLEFAEGTDYNLKYDFSSEDYSVLKEKYDIEKIAGSGSEFEKALNLMDEFAPRLYHKSDYDNHIALRALDLLEYSLDNKKQGINCRSKAQILNEMCLALGIYSRKVWIMPNSSYDNDCHVVNEVWDESLNKWIMLDITNNQYWIDENGTPLSVLEIRSKGANMEFCTPVEAEESTDNPYKLKEKHLGEFLYIMKNMVYMEYCDEYSSYESENFYLLFPENLVTSYEKIISSVSIEKSPE